MSQATLSNSYEKQPVAGSTSERARPSDRAWTVARVLLGLVFTVFGLNGFFQFLPAPTVGESASAFLGALAAAGYVFPVIKSVEVLVGLSLLSGRFVPLALTLLAPITVNIILFHSFLDPSGLLLPLVVLGLHLSLAWRYRDAYRGVLAA